MQIPIMHGLRFIVAAGVFWLLAGTAMAETFKLTTGQELTGEVLPASANDLGVQIRIEEGKYEKVPWASFSQLDLKTLAQNRKMEPFVEPFIEITPEERIQKTEVKIQHPPRLERPAAQSLAGALFSSGLGLLLILTLYAANIYAGYEVSIFRAQPTALVCGVSALLPVLGPIIFLAMPLKAALTPEVWETSPQTNPEGTAAAGSDPVVNPMRVAGVAHPAGLRLAQIEMKPAEPAQPEITTYQRGQFTFNRRFFETKFPNFFGIVRRDEDRSLMLVIKSARGEYTGNRISRIAANDLHLQIRHGLATEEVMIPFQEIQEIQLKQKGV